VGEALVTDRLQLGETVMRSYSRSENRHTDPCSG